LALAFDHGGQGRALLVLLHGLGATRQVWSPLTRLLEEKWPGRWLAPDMPGHGQSGWASNYAPGAQAEQVADLVKTFDTGDVVLLGHSMGGVVALILGTDLFGLRVRRVLGVGVKVVWTAPEISALTERAAGPPRLFESEAAAVERYLKVSGLIGLVHAGHDLARAGVARVEAGWRLAMDPRAHAVGAPDMAALTGRAKAPFALAAGSQDPMVGLEDLRAWDPRAEALEGLGHNVMVQDPAATWNWIDRALSGSASPRERPTGTELA